MDILSSSTMKTTQHSPSLHDVVVSEWKAMELMDDFVSNSYMLPSKVHAIDEFPLIDENGFPKSITQFVA